MDKVIGVLLGVVVTVFAASIVVTIFMNSPQSVDSSFESQTDQACEYQVEQAEQTGNYDSVSDSCVNALPADKRGCLSLERAGIPLTEGC